MNVFMFFKVLGEEEEFSTHFALELSLSFVGDHVSSQGESGSKSFVASFVGALEFLFIKFFVHFEFYLICFFGDLKGGYQRIWDR